MSDRRILQNQINSLLDGLLENFDGQYDLIDFEKEKFIPVEYESIKSFGFHNRQYDSNDFLNISFKESNNPNTIIYNSDFNLKYDEIYNSCQRYIENNGISNVYISFGVIEFDGYLGPCILVPIFLGKNENDYRIFRNFNQEIQFNGILKFILDEENVDFPEFENNIDDFIKQIMKTDGVNYYPEAYIGIFDLKFQHLFYDLNVDKWDSIQDKYNLFKNNQDLLMHNNQNRFMNSLEKNAAFLDINEDVLHLKSLISMSSSVLVIADNSTRDKIKSSFEKDDLEFLLLELSEDLSENDFYENIINSEIIENEDIIELDNIVKRHDKYSKILNLISTNYSNFKINPKEIKVRKDKFTLKIDELGLDNYIFEMENANDYDEESCKEMLEQIKKISSFGESIFNLQNHVSLDYLQSQNFNNLILISESIERHIKYFNFLNKKLNEDYRIKIFENLFSVNQLLDVSVLDKNPILIENNDLNLLNDYLKNYSYDSENVMNNDLDKYFGATDDFIKSIEINLKYTELINNEIICENSAELILNDFDNVVNLSKYFVNVAYYIIKEIYEIINFYNKFKLFTVDSVLLKADLDLDNIDKLIDSFKSDIETLVNFKQDYISFNILNKDVENFIRFVYDNKFKNYEIEPVFWFNIYNSLLNNFLNDFGCIDEDKICEGYEFEFDEINDKLVYDKEQLLVQHIYSKPLELNNSEKSIKQKENLIKIHNEGDLESIKVMLSKYKEFITSNKRIFLMNLNLISQFLDESYENHFDYVIITQDLRNELDRISLLLRTKNKIIKV